MSQLLPWLGGGAPPASVPAAPLPPQLIAGALALLVMVGVGSAMRAHHYLLIPEDSKSPAVRRRAWQHASQLALPLLKAA